jgi:hypothetical protein
MRCEAGKAAGKFRRMRGEVAKAPSPGLLRNPTSPPRGEVRVPGALQRHDCSLRDEATLSEASPQHHLSLGGEVGRRPGEGAFQPNSAPLRPPFRCSGEGWFR